MINVEAKPVVATVVVPYRDVLYASKTRFVKVSSVSTRVTRKSFNPIQYETKDLSFEISKFFISGRIWPKFGSGDEF